MDFFDSQDIARKNTGRLVILFILAVLAIMVMVYLVVAGGLIFSGYKGPAGETDPRELLLDPRLIVTIGLGTLAVIGLGSLFKIMQLRAGGPFIAESLGGVPIHPNTTDPTERKLLNVVEEMSIASGTPCPPVYMLNDEKGINAFAAGYSPDDAVIGVTRGCAEQLNRDELQGVIAHEFSHILSGDMRLNIRLMGVLNGILIIGIIGYLILRSGVYSGAGHRRSGKDGGAGAILAVGAGLAAVGFIGTFFGNWIKAAVSRQREYLADASAVQFTRNPSGIADALKRIGGYTKGSKVTSPNAPEASHMFFGRAITSGLSSMFATHPPLQERIGRIDPSWEGEFLTSRSAENDRGAPSGTAAVAGFAGGAAPTAKKPKSKPSPAISQIGQPTEAHIDYAAMLIRSIPEPVLHAAREPYGARALIYALLIDKDPEPRKLQFDCLSAHADANVCRLTRQMLPTVESLPRELRLPIIDLAIPALRVLSPDQYRSFKNNVIELVKADVKIDLFEWSLQRILLHHLEPQFSRVRPPRVQYYSLARLDVQCATLLSILAHIGHKDQTAAAHAFNKAAIPLGVSGMSLLPPDQCTMPALDRALSDLSEVAPRLKRPIINACATCISADGEITIAEAELFRAIADSLACPMPPLLPGQPLI